MNIGYIIMVIVSIPILIFVGKRWNKLNEDQMDERIKKHEAEAAKEQKIIADWNRQHPDQQVKS